MSKVVGARDLTDSNKQPHWKVTDMWWLTGVAVSMMTSGMFEFLSPRTTIGQVSVLWIPSAVLMVALLRNWSRWVFCGLAIAIFYIVGMYSSFSSGTSVSTFLLLTADIVEVLVISYSLCLWGDVGFRLTRTLNVCVFSAVAVFACGVSSVLAAWSSSVHIGTAIVAANAPIAVGTAWFMANLATYFLVGALLISLTAPGSGFIWVEIKRAPLSAFIASASVMLMTFVGHWLPSWLAQTTGVTLGSGGLILIAFPLTAFFAFERGPIVAAAASAAIGIPTVYATIFGYGPFGKGDISDNIFDMQATIIVCAFTLLLIGAMAHELRARSRALEHSLEDAIKLRNQKP